MRKIIAQSIEMRRFEPKDKALWDEAYEKFMNMIKS